VLFELLTGALPLDLDKLPYDEVLRRLRDEDVPRPSTRVSDPLILRDTGTEEIYAIDVDLP
jgi:hypothetical protein